MRISDLSSDVCSSDLAMHTRNLDDCAIRSNASLQTDDSAGRRERVFDVVDDFLVRIPGNLVDIFTERLARNRHTIAMKETAVQQSLHQHVDAARFIHVLGHVIAAWLQVRDVRCCFEYLCYIEQKNGRASCRERVCQYV